MKKLVGIILTAILVCGLTENVDAQLLKRLKNKVENKAKDKINQKIDEKLEAVANKMVDRTWNSIFGPETGTYDEPSSSGSTRSLPFSPNSHVKTEDHYNFRSLSVMEIVSTDESGKTEKPLYMKMYLGEKDSYTGTAFTGGDMEDEVFLVYDLENEAMIMLMESEEGKFSFAYEWDQLLDEEDGDEAYSEEDYEENYAGYTSLGTKTILGYECEGYRSETEEQITDIWISKDPNLGYKKMIDANSNTRFLRGFMLVGHPEGSLLELHSKMKNSQEQVTMKMTRINEKIDLSYDMSDYPVIGSK